MGAGVEVDGAVGVRAGVGDHDVGVVEVELHAAGCGVAIAEVLGEVEDAG